MSERSATRNEVTVVSATKDADRNSALCPVRSNTSEANPDGTFYQTQAALEPSARKRKHFFSPPPPQLAEAVNKDAETVEYTPEEEVCGRRVARHSVVDRSPTERSRAQDRRPGVDVDYSQVS